VSSAADSSLSLRPATGRGEWKGPLVDADVHAVVPSIEALYPYLDPVWIQYIDERKWPGPSPAMTYPPNMAASARPEWRPEDGTVPASNLALLQEHVLDRWDVDVAILNCVYPIDGGHPDLSAALAAAVNDWLAAEWLDRDPRLRASIVLPGRLDPAAMVAEIDRMGGHPGFVQALLPVRSGQMYGKRVFWPVLEAIIRNDLVAGIHWGGSNDGLPSTPSGWPSYFIEEYVAEIQVYESQLMNLVAEGTFQKFPTLRMSMLEIGFTWVPMWMWDIDRNWKGMRREVPWLTRPPFEDVREHMRFSVSPLDCDSAEELAPIVEWMGSDEMLLYATDYPHAHDDDIAVLLGALSEQARPRVMSENAREWYRLDAPAGAADE
jgi:predicted TIM-barrel fold metal-dependent hydrolase